MSSSDRYVLTGFFFKSRYNVNNFEGISEEIITIVGKLVLDSHFPIIE